MFCWVKQCNVPDPAPECFNSTLSPILCQHGETECQQDTLEGCAFALASSAQQSLDFLLCFEGDHKSDLGSAETCAKSSGLTMALYRAVLRVPRAPASTLR